MLSSAFSSVSTYYELFKGMLSKWKFRCGCVDIHKPFMMSLWLTAGLATNLDRLSILMSSSKIYDHSESFNNWFKGSLLDHSYTQALASDSKSRGLGLYSNGDAAT